MAFFAVAARGMTVSAKRDEAILPPLRAGSTGSFRLRASEKDSRPAGRRRGLPAARLFAADMMRAACACEVFLLLAGSVARALDIGAFGRAGRALDAFDVKIRCFILS